MAENASTSTGQICWYEVPVTSVSRASVFYSSILGWNCTDLEGTPSPASYAKSVHMFNKGSLNGAFLLMQHEEGVAKVADSDVPEKHVPVTTFLVESIEETIRKVEAAGGKVHIPRTEIGGDRGFFARFVDTEGNLQGVWAKE